MWTGCVHGKTSESLALEARTLSPDRRAVRGPHEVLDQKLAQHAERGTLALVTSCLDPSLLLERYAQRSGARRAVLASSDGLLVAGAGAEPDALEELAALAPSSLPHPAERPDDLFRRRVELSGDRLYLAALGAPLPEEAAEALADLLD